MAGVGGTPCFTLSLLGVSLSPGGHHADLLSLAGLGGIEEAF